MTEAQAAPNGLNLFQRINEVRKRIDYIKKDKDVSAGAGGNYKAVTHDMVTAMVRDHLVACGIACYPSLVASTMNLPVVDTDGKTAKQRLYEATYDFHFVNIDDPKEEIVLRIEAHAMDNGDKAPGKALSYAKKMAVLKLFDIETGEDDESRSADNSIEEATLAELVSSLNNAKTLDELKLAYETAYPIAEKAKDVEAQRAIIKAKNARGKELTKKAAQ